MVSPAGSGSGASGCFVLLRVEVRPAGSFWLAVAEVRPAGAFGTQDSTALL